MQRKTVLITGASQGLGFEFAKIFLKERYDLILVAKDRAKLMHAAQELDNGKNEITVIAKDLSQSTAAEELYKTITEKKLSIDVLVNNAGFATHGPFIENDVTSEKEEIGVNITTLTLLTKLLARDMVSKKSGKILNIASAAAYLPGPLMAVYHASKAYVLSFSEALREELKGTGVTVTCLCPGPTHTGFAKRAKTEGTRLFNSGVMSAQEVAYAGYIGLVQGKEVVIPGIKNRVAIELLRIVPRSILPRMVKRMHSPK